MTALPEMDTAFTPRLLPATLTSKADLSGVWPVSRASEKVMVTVDPSTAADETVGAVVSLGVPVASPEASLSPTELTAVTRKAYSVPSVRPLAV